MAALNLPAGTVLNAPGTELPDFAKRFVNLASADYGATVTACSDEWFAEANRMLQAAEPVFVVGKFDEHGKWMDGWETRRKRSAGFDHAVIRLGMPGVIKGFDIDTSHFSGNHPLSASIDVCHCAGDPDDATPWRELVAAAPMSAKSHHFFPIEDSAVWTHCRLNIHPDGGIARFRVYGQPFCDYAQLPSDSLHEVSALAMGGRIVSYNDAHFGVPFRLIMPGRGVNMGDGWETRRRREPGYDWCIVQLGHRAVIERVEIDTAHFKGNYPDRISLQAASCGAGTDESVTAQAMFWPTLLPEQKAQMDHQHFFESPQIADLGPVTHVKLNMHPDGGVSRLRIWGRLA